MKSIESLFYISKNTIQIQKLILKIFPALIEAFFELTQWYSHSWRSSFSFKTSQMSKVNLNSFLLQNLLTLRYYIRFERTFFEFEGNIHKFFKFLLWTGRGKLLPSIYKTLSNINQTLFNYWPNLDSNIILFLFKEFQVCF